MVEEYEKIEMAKRKLKEEQLEQVLTGKLPESAIVKVGYITKHWPYILLCTYMYVYTLCACWSALCTGGQ